MSRNKKYSLIVAVLVAVLLCIAKLKTSFPILVMDRFMPEWGGWIQIGVASLLGMYVYERLMRGGNFRLLFWGLFSFVFFTQLILGVFVSGDFLMTGELHFPVPMVIEGGLFYRLHLSFMPILFIVTLLLVGGGWCSHLCYFGSWDAIMAKKFSSKRSIRKISSPTSNTIRWTIFCIVAITAYLLGRTEMPLVIILGLMSVWITLSLISIFILTPYFGQMTHCTIMCPMGAVVSIGKYLSPWRIKIDQNNCTGCNKCAKECRYGAIETQNRKAKTNINCTLCGDCQRVCKHKAINYKLIGYKKEPKEIYYIILTALWVVFIMTARV